MYLRPDEVARVLEKAGFTMDAVTAKAYGYRRGKIMFTSTAKRGWAYGADHSPGAQRP